MQVSHLLGYYFCMQTDHHVAVCLSLIFIVAISRWPNYQVKINSKRSDIKVILSFISLMKAGKRTIKRLNITFKVLIH